MRDVMHPIRSLYNGDANHAEAVLPPELRAQYGGDLHFPVHEARPYVVANFVSTLDGVVSFNIPGKSGGAEISGSNEGDRFIMGLLRASADAVMVGAGTVAAVPRRALWTPGYIYPAAGDAYAGYRRKLRNRQAEPLIVIVSGKGTVDLDRSIFHTSGISVLIFVGASGRDRVLREGAAKLPSTRIVELPAADGKIDPHLMLGVLKADFRVGVLLHEGGPTLLGDFVGAGVLDELFLTLAPQIAGRNPGHSRPGLIAGGQFVPDTAPWLTLLSIKQQGSHVYLRYRRTEKAI